MCLAPVPPFPSRVRGLGTFRHKRQRRCFNTPTRCSAAERARSCLSFPAMAKLWAEARSSNTGSMWAPAYGPPALPAPPDQGPTRGPHARPPAVGPRTPHGTLPAVTRGPETAGERLMTETRRPGMGGDMVLRIRLSPLDSDVNSASVFLWTVGALRPGGMPPGPGASHGHPRRAWA